jgi:hypothetical protein
MKKMVELYVHASKEAAYEAAEKAGFTGEALGAARYLGHEHKMTYEVSEDGYGTLIAVDGRQLEKEKQS